jgi:hypothetical protein
MESSQNELDLTSPSQEPNTVNVSMKQDSSQVEDSMDAINELLDKLNDSKEEILENPSSTGDSHQASFQTLLVQKQMSKIRFSLFRIGPPGSTRDNTSLPLLKFFFKLVITTSKPSKILPIRNNTNIQPLKTSDQINELTLHTMKYFIKPVKTLLKHSLVITILPPPSPSMNLNYTPIK